MELLTVHMGRAIWLFDLAELNPRGKSLMPELLEWLKDTYNFETAPSKITELDPTTKALLFERGRIQVREEVFVDIGLKVFNDGLVAETQSSTRDADAFLEDLMVSATKEFNLTFKPRMIRHKLYFSELFVFSEKTLTGVHPKAAEFAAKIDSFVPSRLGAPFQVSAFSFWPTQTTAPPVVIGPFRFERKLQTNPSEGKYYSTAPLHTDDHLRLLEEFESIFMS
jgi:hypothetical protein